MTLALALLTMFLGSVGCAFGEPPERVRYFDDILDPPTDHLDTDGRAFSPSKGPAPDGSYFGDILGPSPWIRVGAWWVNPTTGGREPVDLRLHRAALPADEIGVELTAAERVAEQGAIQYLLASALLGGIFLATGFALGAWRFLRARR